MMILQSIEEVIKSKKTVIWSRKIEEELLIDQINNKLSDDEAKVFYNSLPDDLKNYFIKSKMIS